MITGGCTAVLLTVGVLAAGFGVSQAAAAATQPPQPKSGPGAATTRTVVGV
jgi:hypothetical protein